MGLALRRCFWMADLAFAAGAAALCAATAMTLLARPIALPEFPQARPARLALAKPALDAEAVSQLTGLPLGGVEVAPPGPVDAASLARSTLPVRLLGTSVSNFPELSRATVQDLQGQATDVYAVGDALHGATVVSIERLRVVVENGGRREVIDLEGSIAEANAPGAASAAPTPPPSGALSSVQAQGPNTFVLSRTEVLRAASNLEGLGRGVFVAPALVNGEPVGWKFSKLNPGSPLAQIGLKQGDVLRRVNGFELKDPAATFEALTRIKDAARVEIELERNGTAQRLEYRFRD